MKNYSMLAGLICASLLALPDTALAHGGKYRGPEDIVPPNAGGGKRPGGPNTPQPTTPGARPPGVPVPTPGPNTGGRTPPPISGGGNNPANPGRAARTGGIVLSDDLSKWQYWWEFNKDPFINLREALHAPATITGDDDFIMGFHKRRGAVDRIKPSESDIQEVILPALKRALDTTNNRDITSSCMIAMAKIGRDHSTFAILPIFEANLDRPNQEIRETAALAMGIAGLPQARTVLVDLAMDTPAGRALVPGAEVGYRTRSFAIYALGLLAHRSGKLDIKREVFASLAKILRDRNIRNRNIKVAAIHAASLLNLQPAPQDKKAIALLAAAVSTLELFYDRKAGPAEDLVKAHVPTAIAKLIGRGTSARHEYLKAQFSKTLNAKKKRGNDIYRSAAQALGQMVMPGKADDRYSKQLYRYFKSGRDQQTRFFALMAMGQIGGTANRTRLAEVLRKGRKALDRPWAGLALGVMSHHRMAAADSATVDALVGADLLTQFEGVKTPAARAAFAVALGLTKYTDSAPSLLKALKKHRKQDELAGYLCLALALMNEHKAKEDIHDIVRSSARRPGLLRQAAVALGKLGDRTVANTLMAMLEGTEPNLAKLSAAAAALSFIGDRRTIRPLKAMLFNEDLTPLSRAFAAVALGGVADKEKLPWSSKLSRNINYRASVETLTQSGAGVLDIL